MAANSRDFISNRRKWILHLLLILICILFLVPIYWMLCTALKQNSQIFQWPLVLFPHPAQWINFKDALVASNFGRYLLNTLLLSIFVIMGNLFSCTLVAYGFSRIEWKGRDAVFVVVLATMLLPEQVTLIPLFVIFKHLGLVGGGYKGYLPLIIPAFFGKAYFIFMMRQFFMGIPQELSDAARIDGCSEIGILWRIIMPLAKPAMVAVSLFSLINTWSDFLGPIVYLREKDFFTISVGLAMFQSRSFIQWNQVMAASAMSIIPILIVFIFAQKQFVEGISMTGFK